MEKGDKISTEKDLMELFDESRYDQKAISLLVEERFNPKARQRYFVIDENISFP